MLVQREYHIAAGKCVCGLDVVPIVEVWAAVGNAAMLHSCLAQARPLGFAILTSEKGYWLTRAQDLAELAHAVAGVTTQAS